MRLVLAIRGPDVTVACAMCTAISAPKCGKRRQLSPNRFRPRPFLSHEPDEKWTRVAWAEL